MTIRTYTVVRGSRTTTLEMDSSLYERAVIGNKGARDSISIRVKEKFRLKRYVSWGSFTITPPVTTTAGSCDECAWCDIGNHHQCKNCTL